VHLRWLNRYAGAVLAIQRDLRAAADPVKAAFFPKFFKAGKGEYAEGDQFLGLSVPQVRSIMKQYANLPLDDIHALLQSKWHEERLAGFLLLVLQYERGNDSDRVSVVRFYTEHLDYANNWDLVDASAYKILGRHLLGTKDPAILDRLAASGHLWRERTAVVATYAFIREGDFSHTFRLAEGFLCHPHDLMHKATGWMLREVGKRNKTALCAFLDKNAVCMPRTMLRYAIERFPESLRQHYLLAK
jgi:3-methyladenine DNA glycosylase AlkD